MCNVITFLNFKLISSYLLICYLRRLTSAHNEMEMQHLSAAADKLSSLVVVFDVTGSMSEELSQVKKGITNILNFFVRNREKPIHDLIFVPFSDPDVGPILSTDDPSQFINMLQNLTIVQGGGDCPEMALTALTIGLENSAPKSHIFVFTDADPKDTEMLPNVLSLIRKKQNQVHFLLTGTCRGIRYSYSKEYQQISSISTGQIFDLVENDIFKVMEFIRFSIRAPKVNLVAVDHPGNLRAPQRYKYEILIDDTMTDLIISVSGRRVNFNVSDSLGQIVDEVSANASWLLKLESIKIIRILDVFNQYEKVFVNVFTQSSFSLRSIGSSILNLQYGFSLTDEWPKQIDEMNYLPFKGLKNFFFVKPVNYSGVLTLLSCKFMALNGSVINMIILQMVENSTDGLHYGVFEPVDTDFYLKIHGLTKQDAYFNRVTFSAIRPDSSAILMSLLEKQEIYLNESHKISCKVQSAQLFQVRWLKNGLDLSRSDFLKYNGEVILQIHNVSLEDEGNYTCLIIRKNEANVSKSVNVVVTVNPVIIESKTQHVNLTLYEDFGMTCPPNENPGTHFFWVYNSSKINSSLFNDNLLILPNNRLVLLNAMVNQSGYYSCYWEYETGKKELLSRYEILVTDPVVPSLPSTTLLKVILGQQARISCTGGEYVSWLKDFYPLDMSLNDRADVSYYVLRDSGATLEITTAYEEDSGYYLCVSTNATDTYERFFYLLVIAPLYFKYHGEKIRVAAREYGCVTLDCSVNSEFPKPMVTWRKKGFPWVLNQWTLASVTFHRANKQILSIYPFEEHLHAGSYECVVTNEIFSIKRNFVIIPHYTSYLIPYSSHFNFLDGEENSRTSFIYCLMSF